MTLTGWTWRDIDLQMTLPRLFALQRVWRTLPPVAVQLLNIGQALGIQRTAPAAGGQTPDRAEPDDEAQGLLTAMPTAHLPKIMSAADYLRQRAGENDATLDT